MDNSLKIFLEQFGIKPPFLNESKIIDFLKARKIDPHNESDLLIQIENSSSKMVGYLHEEHIKKGKPLDGEDFKNLFQTYSFCLASPEWVEGEFIKSGGNFGLNSLKRVGIPIRNPTPIKMTYAGLLLFALFFAALCGGATRFFIARRGYQKEKIKMECQYRILLFNQTDPNQNRGMEVDAHFSNWVSEQKKTDNPCLNSGKIIYRDKIVGCLTHPLFQNEPF